MDPLERDDDSTDFRPIPTCADLAWGPTAPLPANAEIVRLFSGRAANAVYAPPTPGDLIYVPVFCWALVRIQRNEAPTYGIAGFVIRPPQAPGDTNVIVRADTHPHFLGYQSGFEPPLEVFQSMADTIVMRGAA